MKWFLIIIIIIVIIIVIITTLLAYLYRCYPAANSCQDAEMLQSGDQELWQEKARGKRKGER